MGGDNGDMATRSELLSFSAPGGQSAGRNPRLCGGVRSSQKNAGRDLGGRPRFRVVLLREDRQYRDSDECGRRIPSLRLERMLVVPMSERAASARGATLLGRAGTALVAHIHPRYQA